MGSVTCRPVLKGVSCAYMEARKYLLEIGNCFVLDVFFMSLGKQTSEDERTVLIILHLLIIIYLIFLWHLF